MAGSCLPAIRAIIHVLKIKIMGVDPSIIAAGIAATASTINTANQANYAGKNKRQAEKLMKWQHDTNLTDWGLENEYNSPENQMKRLKAAGLNPNLIYGSGSSGMSGGSVNSTGAPSGGTNQEAPQLNLGGIIGDFVQLQMMDKQKDLLTAQIEATRTNAQLSAAGIPLRQQEFQQKQDLFPGQLTALELSNRKILADTQYTLHQDERQQALQAFNIQLADQGVKKAIQEVLLLRAQRSKNAAEIRHINQMIKNLDSQKVQTDLQTELLKVKPTPANFLRVIGNYVNDSGNVERVKKGRENADKSWEEYEKQQKEKRKKQGHY